MKKSEQCLQFLAVSSFNFFDHGTDEYEDIALVFCYSKVSHSVLDSQAASMGTSQRVGLSCASDGLSL